MEFFLPGLAIFFITLYISSLVLPTITPLIASVLSIVFLSFGVYQHYKMFASEYRLSTWHEGLKAYSPAAMIVAIMVFIIYSIFAFFNNGSIPVPSIRNRINSMNENSMNENSMNENSMNSMNENSPNKQNNQKNGKNKASRSFLETL